MRSLPSRLPKSRRRSPTARLTPFYLVGLTACWLLVLSCGSGGGRPTTPEEVGERQPNLTPAERPYLADPMEGYPLVVSPVVEEELRAAHEGLLALGDADGARALATEWLATDPGLHPAHVLAAQADFAAGLEAEALERVRPVVEELPGYIAAALLLGRLEERRGEALEAFRAFRAVGAVNRLAADRVTELGPMALEQVGDQIAESLARGRLDLAEEALAELREWAPAAEPTLEAAIAVAVGQGDPEAELEALRELSMLRPDDRTVQERRGDLELEAGEPGRGLEIFETLAEAHPDDSELADKLAFAKFRWRLTLLPDRVQQVAGLPELERGDYAVLLYWLLPSVRYGRPARTRIAADILDDPRREEIARVVNLDLMDVDERLHRFSPADPVRRVTVLASQLDVLESAERPRVCVQDFPDRPSIDTVCTTAVRCTLLDRVEDCLPQATVSGREALDLLRRTLELVAR